MFCWNFIIIIIILPLLLNESKMLCMLGRALGALAVPRCRISLSTPSPSFAIVRKMVTVHDVKFWLDLFDTFVRKAFVILCV